MLTRRTFGMMLAVLPCAVATSGPVTAESYPTRPIKLIVPQSAGGPTDSLARLIARQLSAALDEPVVVDNRPGGGLMIGTRAAAAADPDGYTLLFAPPGPLNVPLMDWFGLRLFEQRPDEAHISAALSEHSPMQFRWSDSALKLDRAAARTDGCQVVEAALGNPALATIALSMTRLPGSAGSVLCTSTANAIYAVVRGSGTTEVGKEEFAWQRGDVVAVPAQHPHAHRANECAVLLTVTDAPTMSWLQGRHDPAS